MASLYTFGLGDLANIITCFRLMAFEMGRTAIRFVIITAHGNGNDVLNFPCLPGFNLSLAQVANAIMGVE